MLRVRRRGIVKDAYEQMKVDNSNLYAFLGATNSQPGSTAK